MSHLGSFGAAQRELDPNAEKDEFDLCGKTFTVTGIIPPVIHYELSAAMVGHLTSAAGYGAMYAAFREALSEHNGAGEITDDRQFRDFMNVAARHNVATEELVDLAVSIYEAQTARPTKGLPGSSPGQSETGPSSSTSATEQVSPYPGMTPVAVLLDRQRSGSGSPAT